MKIADTSAQDVALEVPSKKPSVAYNRGLCSCCCCHRLAVAAVIATLGWCQYIRTYEMCDFAGRFSGWRHDLRTQMLCIAH